MRTATTTAALAVGIGCGSIREPMPISPMHTEVVATPAAESPRVVPPAAVPESEVAGVDCDPAQTLFACPMAGGKALRVCQANGALGKPMVQYRYGPVEGIPELILATGAGETRWASVVHRLQPGQPHPVRRRGQRARHPGRRGAVLFTD